MTCVVGVDGCKGGWIAVSLDTTTNKLEPRIHTSFQQVLDCYPNADAIGVDIPIGLGKGVLGNAEPRACDDLARGMLQHRHVTVFSAPDMRLIDQFFYEQAPIVEYEEVLSYARKITGKGISQQTKEICPKIAEVNRVMTPAVQRQIVEIHPEVSFCALAGRPMEIKKKSVAGFDERRDVLVSRLGWTIWSRDVSLSLCRDAKKRMGIKPGPDDLLDATVAAWSASRVTTGKAVRLPDNPQFDCRGLRMEIVY